MRGDLLAFFAIAAFLAGSLALIGIWAPRKLWVKVTALVTTGLFLPVAYLSMSDLLSRPKPIDMEWTHIDLAEAAVLGARLEEDVAIYLWLAIEGLEEPRSYVLPWDQNMAEQLYDAQRAAEEQGTGVRVQMPFETSLDTQERKFYAEPQPPLPEKQVAPQSPAIFEHSRTKAAEDGA